MPNKEHQLLKNILKRSWLKKTLRNNYEDYQKNDEKKQCRNRTTIEKYPIKIIVKKNVKK